VFALGDRVVALESGKVLATGTPQEVMRAPRYESVAQLAGFENMFDAAVIFHHEAQGTMTCRLERRVHGGAAGVRAEQPSSHVKPRELEAPRGRREPGSMVRLAIRSGDILLSTLPPRSLSARNVIQGSLLSMKRVGVTVVADVECGVRFQVDLTPGA